MPCKSKSCIKILCYLLKSGILQYPVITKVYSRYARHVPCVTLMHGSRSAVIVWFYRDSLGFMGFKELCPIVL
jgi:hypothetical protein